MTLTLVPCPLSPIPAAFRLILASQPPIPVNPRKYYY
jgi:hypothetical protein